MPTFAELTEADLNKIRLSVKEEIEAEIKPIKADIETLKTDEAMLRTEVSNLKEYVKTGFDNIEKDFDNIQKNFDRPNNIIACIGLPMAILAIGATLDLKKLVNLLQEYIGEVHIRIDCEDKITREYNTVEELSVYENTKSKKICKLSLSARSNDYRDSTTADINFDDTTFIGVLSIHFNGNEEVVSKLKNKSEDIIEGMQQWYYQISSFSFLTGWLIGCAALFFILQVFIFFEWIPVSDTPIPPSSSAKGSAMVVVFLSGAALIIGGLHRLRLFLFPKIIFAIGQEKYRLERLKIIRRVVISSSITLIVGIIIKYFW